MLCLNLRLDCGFGEAFKLKKKGVACVCVKTEAELGLKKKREKDENYRDESDDDDDIIPPVDPFGRPKPNNNPKRAVGEKPKIATLFNH
jgi:hypothetical protein